MEKIWKGSWSTLLAELPQRTCEHPLYIEISSTISFIIVEVFLKIKLNSVTGQMFSVSLSGKEKCSKRYVIRVNSIEIKKIELI